MKFQCLNESCGKLFVHPAVETIPATFLNLFKDQEMEEFKETQNIGSLETRVCPYCRSKDIEEYTPQTEQPTPEEIANVYIYDLTTGHQTGLDNLLAEGYRIVNRYSKQYHLEKPKKTPVDATPTEAPA